jgi:hypothetical protein
MPVTASVNPPSILVNKTFQLDEAPTEIKAAFLRGSEMYLAVNSDLKQCGH